MVKREEIERVQEVLFGRIESELANGYDSAIHDSYQSRTVLQFAQTINQLEQFKNSLELPWREVK